ncbi:MAG: hypothetical protein GYB66_16765 [Chloroflexi bacterium]|nr:hypothetical protein [Chloroflexota bacterium]
MNISEAVQALAIQTEALVLLGDDPSSRAYEALVLDRAFPVRIVRTSGAIRSNIVLVDTGNNATTVLKESGDEVSQQTLVMVADQLESLIQEDDYVVFAGALPPAAGDDTYAWLTSVANSVGARVVLNADGNVLDLALRSAPDVVMLSQIQLESFFNHPIRALEDVISAATKMQEIGPDCVLIMLNDDTGAVLVTAEEQFIAEFPTDVDTEGTYTGTHDAMIAGFLAGRLRNHSLKQCLVLAGASMLYTATQVGTEFGDYDAIQPHIPSVKVMSLEEYHDNLTTQTTD